MSSFSFSTRLSFASSSSAVFSRTQFSSILVLFGFRDRILIGDNHVCWGRARARLRKGSSRNWSAGWGKSLCRIIDEDLADVVIILCCLSNGVVGEHLLHL